tara:strand:+ start:41 stop:373 length:333 start_codon:yes stop_codon:yes gene_type:complete
MYSKEYSKQYYEKNKDKIKKNARLFHIKNPNYQKEYWKKRYYNDIEYKKRIREYQKKHFKKKYETDINFKNYKRNYDREYYRKNKNKINYKRRDTINFNIEYGKYIITFK